MKTLKNKKRSLLSTMIIVSSVVLSDFSIAQQSRGVRLDGPDCYEWGNAEELKGPEIAPVPLSTASFTLMGAPIGGYPTITDLTTFNSKLFLSTSKSPLGDFGTNVFSTTNGTSFTNVLDDPSSQGFLRMQVFDNKLWIPDGDPNGLDPSFVYISSTGALGSFTKTTILGSVHSFDIIKYNNEFYVSNGMNSGQGGLNTYDGSNTWNSAYQSTSSMRMKYMAVFSGKLFAANRLSSSDVDLFVWSGTPGTSAPVLANPVSGATNTFRIFTSSLANKLYWSVASSVAQTMVTSDGIAWTAVSTLASKVVSDFTEFNGKLYALAHDGLYESTDFSTFTLIASPPASDATAFTPAVPGPGMNPDAVASMEVFNGALWCGSSRNGKLYRVDFSTTSIPENMIASMHYTMTDHSIIFDLETPASVQLRVYNLVGSLIKTVSLGTVSKGNYEINLNDLKAGVYLLEAIIGDETKGIRFIRR